MERKKEHARVNYVLTYMDHGVSHHFQNIPLLDAGCGTGQHAEALLKMGIGEITLLDASPEMLTVAAENVGQYVKHKRAHIVEAVIPPLPFQDNSFDAVMFIQVHVYQTMI